jgi:hypothetical protein
MKTMRNVMMKFTNYLRTRHWLKDKRFRPFCLCNDEIYQLAKDQTLVKKLKKQKI